MYVVSYEIIGDAEAPETGTASAFELEGSGSSASSVVPTVRSLWEGFPYEGRFHFRAKVPAGASGGGGGEDNYAWLDLTDPDAPLPVWREEAGQAYVDVRVLPLALPSEAADDAVAAEAGETLDYSGGDLDDDILEASYGGKEGGASYSYEQEAEQYHRRRREQGSGDGGSTWSQSLKGATETVLTSEITRDMTKLGKKVGKQVGKGINSLFKSVLSAAAGDQGGMGSGSSGGYPGTAPAPPSHAAVKTLRALEEAVGRAPSADLLVGLWLALFPNAGPFAARSPQWKQAGFAGEDPLPDLRGTGTVCVQCILHFARQHPGRLQAILREQAPRDQEHYPFAAVANSLALMLIGIFKLDGRYQHVQAVFWGLFEGGRGASAVEEVFAPCLAYLDRRWNETGATRDQFPSLIQETRRRLENVLGQGPASLGEFARLAEASGLYVE